VKKRVCSSRKEVVECIVNGLNATKKECYRRADFEDLE